MVARIFRLRLALLFAPLSRRNGRLFRSLLLVILGVAAAAGVAGLPVLLASESAQSLANIDIVFGSVLLISAVVIPFFAPKSTLNPRQFNQYPASVSQVASGILFTSVLTKSFLWFVTWGVWFYWWRRGAEHAAWMMIAALAITLLSALVFARIASALSIFIFNSERAAVFRSTLGVLLLLSALPVALYFLATAIQNPHEDSVTSAAGALGWTPFGAPFAILADAGSEDSIVLLARFGIIAAPLSILIGLWYSLSAVMMTSVSRPLRSAVVRRRMGWFGRLPANPAMLIGARLATYWRRDPRYRLSLFAIPIAPVLIMLVLYIGGVHSAVLALVPVPVILLLLAWMTHNDVSNDSTAFWLHVASGTKGWHDRLGRLFPVFIVGIPVLLIGTSISVTILGDWRVLPSVLGLNLTVLLASSAAASITSVLFPYPATRPGDSPFVQPQWHGSGAGVSQTSSFVGAICLTAPVLPYAIQSTMNPTISNQLGSLLFCLCYGTVILVGGVFIGGAVFNKRAPELLARLQMFD